MKYIYKTVKTMLLTITMICMSYTITMAQESINTKKAVKTTGPAAVQPNTQTQKQVPVTNSNEKISHSNAEAENKPVFKLTDAQTIEIKNIDKLYQKISLVKSEFEQRDSLGHSVTGWFILQKPGKARIEYDKMPIRLIANGNTLLLQNTEKKEKSYIPIRRSPFYYLLQKNFSLFDKKLTITYYIKTDDAIEITFVSTLNPEMGSITLFLNDKGEILHWSVIDAKGIETHVFLLKSQFASDKQFNNQNMFNTHRVIDVDYQNIEDIQ